MSSRPRATGDRATGDRATGDPGPRPHGPGAVDEAVLAAVERIPPGRVMTYGDVAEWVGGRAARTVGRVLARHGGAVPWWRVLRADGSCAEPVREQQLTHLAAEGVPLRGDRVDLSRARWDGVSP